MAKINISIKSTLLICCLLGPSAWASDFDIQNLEQAQLANCTKLASDECDSESSDAEAVCLAELQQKAIKAKADALFISGQESFTQRRPTLVGGVKKVTRLKMQADYYDCGYAAKSAKSAGSVDVPAWQQVEGRLKNLESLKSKGLISAEEYDQKRQDILNDL
ncbi:MAG: SHOCT domain-containing protein [Oceanobacter sp.]